DLVTAVTAYDKKRQDLESHLVVLKEFQTGMEIAKAAKDPIGKLIDTASEKALEKVQDYFKEHRPDLDPDDIKTIWENRKKELEAAWELRGKLKELDDDPVLKGNENARLIARRFAVLGAVYNFTLGRLKDSGLLKGLGPVGDFLAFYGEALNLIPELAKRLQSTVNQVDQDLRNVRGLDQWNVTGLPPAELRQLTTFDAFGLRIATDASIDSITSPNARFYMLVEKEVIPRGFATLSAAEFTRMTEALAYERFLHAPSEASRGVGDWMSENLFEWKTTKVLSGVVSDAYLTDLKKKSRTSLLTPKDLLDLAHNQPVDYKGKPWTAEQFQKEADRTLDARAEE